MLTIIKKENLDSLLQSYPELLEYESNFLLYDNIKEQNFILPRYFKKNYPHPNLIEFKDKDFKPQNIEIEFTGSLRPKQKELIDIISSKYSKNNKISGIIKASPGFGKTICSAYITCMLKKKTLIILDNSKLVEQWRDAYLEFTNISEDDIGYIIGKEFNPKPITITMVQTLVSKIKNDVVNGYKLFKQQGYDLVFFDEMHKTSSTSIFGKASILLNTENIIGLSATPYGDKLHKFFMKNIVGNVIADFANYDQTPEVYFVKYDSGLFDKHGYKIFRTNEYVKRIGLYNKVIPESKSYYKVILTLAKKIVESNRTGIIIVFTKEQLVRTIEYLKQNGIESKALYSKDKAIDKTKDKLIVATYKYASHGFDYAELSCLVLATPLKGKNSLIQTIGRILRKKDGKATPIVFDLIDGGMGTLFTDTIPYKTKIISNEFNVNNCKLINYTNI